MKFIPALFCTGLVAIMSVCTLISPTNASSLELSFRNDSSLAVSSKDSVPEILPEKMTLEQAIEIGLVNNPEIAAVRWDSEAARARRNQTAGQQFPLIGLIGSYTHFVDNQRLFPAGLPGDPSLLSKNIFSGDITLSFPIFTGGRLVNQKKAADLLYLASEHDLSRSREELVFNITSMYYTILAQEHVIESQAFSLKTLEEHVNRINALMNAQKAAYVDKLRTEVQLANIRQELLREKNLISIQYRILKNLLGSSENSNKFVLQGKLAMDTTEFSVSIDTLIETALKRRTDYLAARANVDAQARRVAIAKSSRFPSLALRGSYGFRAAAGQTLGTGDTHGDVGGVGLIMEMPLFEGGKLLGEVREQQANLAAAQERLRKIEQQVSLEVESAISNIQSSRERLNAIMKSIEQANESFRIEQQKYDLGKGAIVDVLDAQNALLETETTYYRVLAEFHIAQAQLQLARGEE
jgi:outer membrane protein TolC